MPVLDQVTESQDLTGAREDSRHEDRNGPADACVEEACGERVSTDNCEQQDKDAKVNTDTTSWHTSSAQGGVEHTKAKDAAGQIGAAPVSLQDLLAACTDGQLTSSFATLLGVLPSEAQARCLVAVRSTLAKEAEASLKGDAAGEALWRRLLGQPKVDASAQKPAKRPVRAMAMPFTSVPAAKRLKEAPLGAGDARHPVEPAPSSQLEEPQEVLSIFMSNIAYEVNEMRLRGFFSEKCKDAKISSVTLLRGPTGKFKGAAVVTFASHGDVERALALNGTVLEDRVLTVREDRGAVPASKRSGPSGKGEGKASPCAVVVKNLDFGASQANLGQLFAGCGEISAARIAKDRRSGRSKGFAVVEFSSAAAVQMALERSGREVCGRAVRIEAMRGAPPVEDVEVEAEAVAPEAESKDEDAAETSTAEKEEAPVALSAGDRFAMAVDDLDALNTDGAEGAAGPRASASLQAHARKLVAQAAEGADVARRRPPGLGFSEAYPSGDGGVRAAAALAELHGSPEALLTAEGPEALKGRLAALGLKAGGTPLQRAERLLQLKGLAAAEQVPKDLLAKRGAAAGAGAALREPVRFVKASSEQEEG